MWNSLAVTHRTLDERDFRNSEIETRTSINFQSSRARTAAELRDIFFRSTHGVHIIIVDILYRPYIRIGRVIVQHDHIRSYDTLYILYVDHRSSMYII